MEKEARQKLFNYFADEHNVILLDTDIQAIERIVLEQPDITQLGTYGTSHFQKYIEDSFGITKEKELIQHYAGQAMQGLLANSVNTSQYSKVVSDSIIIAKEMVAQLKEKGYL